MIVMIALFKSFLVELVCFRFYLKSFFLDGHGTKYKKCMGTQNPRFFPLMGTVPSTKYCWAPGSCPSVKILSKSVGHGSLGDGLSGAACASRSGPLPTDGCCQRDPQHHRLNYNLEEWMEDQKLMDNDPLLALVAKDNNAETLKEGVKAQEKIETEE